MKSTQPLHIILLLILSMALSGCLAPNLEKTQNKAEVVASMTKTLGQQHPNMASITAQRLQELMSQEKEFLLIDARTPEEIEISTLEKAHSKAQWQEIAAQIKPEHLIIVYDTLGYRSIEFIKTLQLQGYQNVHYLAGGVLAWAHADQFFFSKDSTTRRVHVSSKAWNLLPDSYEAIHD